MATLKEQEDTDKLCSFEKGIFNKLKDNKDILSILMAEFIVKNNSKWNSNDFPSSQITKVILKLLISDNITFPVMHRIIKEILKEWESQKICDYLQTTKYGHCRKTKEIYRFSSEGINKLKEFIIYNNIKIIKNSREYMDKLIQTKEIMKTRSSLINEIKFNYEEILYDYINSNEFYNDE
ncbi:MAG: hypothetical protein ACTSWR_03315 [Candidatus Helarchaeota archaeon]